MKKIIALFLCVLVFLQAPMAVFAQPKDDKINAKAVCLMSLDSREVLYKENEYDELSPAFVTKIMSILLVLEAIESGKIKLSDKVTASKDAVAMGGSQIWLELGEVMTVEELLKAVIIASANDACTALGEYVAGSNVAFVKMMNDKVKSLGLKHTNFENCTGLDDTVKNHYSCAYDLAVISCEVMKHPLVKKYSTVWLDSLRNGKTELNNTNKLVKSYNGITGLKTGTTSNAGFCVSATASRNGLNLVAVVLGSDTSEHRFDTAAYLLDTGFANYSCVNAKINSKKIKSVKVKNGKEKSIKPYYNSNLKLILPKGNESISYKYNVKKEVMAPVKKGDNLGTVDIVSNEKKVKSVILYADKDIDTVDFKYIFLNIFKHI